MIKSVTVVNALGERLVMELVSPEKSGFNIYNIEGAGPGKAVINTTEVATGDGSIYNSAKVQSRNIVFTIKFLPSPTVEDTRLKSYRFFSIKKEVLLIFETENRTVEIVGYVEANEPVIFCEEEFAQISLICPFPYFRAAQPNLFLFYEIDQLFEFPFSHESLDEPVIIFGEYRDESVANIHYEGDADAGIIVTIHATNRASNILFYKLFTNESMRINSDKLVEITGSDIVALDEIVISTVKGKKSIYLIREGVRTNILNCLDKNADWPQLTRGDNVFAYTADSGQEYLRLSIEHQKLYEGV